MLPRSMNFILRSLCPEWVENRRRLIEFERQLSCQRTLIESNQEAISGHFRTPNNFTIKVIKSEKRNSFFDD
jgi:hypothetical protein